jgi:hypothetical protein
MKKKMFRERRYGKKIEVKPIVVEEPIKKEKKSKKKVDSNVEPSISID